MARGQDEPALLTVTRGLAAEYALVLNQSADALEAKPGLHLALVRYRRDHLQPVDWVQNLADIDNQKVIWAHDMGAENDDLLRYYKDRHVWLVEPGKTPPEISPYPAF